MDSAATALRKQPVRMDRKGAADADPEKERRMQHMVKLGALIIMLVCYIVSPR